MQVEWHPHKAKLNATKHGVRFADVDTVFSDPLALTIEDVTSEGEERLITIGADLFGRIVTVTYTWRGDAIRLISARKATKREKQSYERGI